MAPHPLDPLSVAETQRAAQVIQRLYPDQFLYFRTIYLEEPPKVDLIKYLEDEHAGKRPQAPPRTAFVQYDLVRGAADRIHYEAILDISKGELCMKTAVPDGHQINLTFDEIASFITVCEASQMYKEAIAQFKLPEGFEVVLEPWSYGGSDGADEGKRYLQGLCFAQNKASGNADANFYPYPLPIVPVMDVFKKEIVNIQRLSTGGKGDKLDDTNTYDKQTIVDHCVSGEYVPELLPEGPRKDLKQLNVIQPDGPSFSIDGQLVEWQGWRFRVGFNPREGATVHDIYFKDRSVVHRLSMSEMTVPYADPRNTFQRKQAFDFGDGGGGACANNLALGCDCLGVIKYFHGVTLSSTGEAKVSPNVVCLHEQDNGIGWKHTNWRTERAVVTRYRELVIQFIITLANYEYIFAYKFDQAGAITVETRATGIVSVVGIDPGKTSDYGNVVSPGALAQNHQHIFCVRIDPAIDGHKNSVVIEESHRAPVEAETNPHGNLYNVVRKGVLKSTWLDGAPQHNRTFKIINPQKINSISGNPVGYKLVAPSTQLLLASPGSLQSERAHFGHHHLWVTKHLDRELFAAGRYTLQSKRETGGVADAVKRDENIVDEDIVLWSVFGITHNPRVEDWPVMPVEIFQVHLKPYDFFTVNPAIDVPSIQNASSVLVDGHKKEICCNL
ncbi:copper amine oxidase 1 [Xylariales sp. PMI_506]|nr:copper amine oxidase 1 [Xylariales sp. PMI_506]